MAAPVVRMVRVSTSPCAAGDERQTWPSTLITITLVTWATVPCQLAGRKSEACAVCTQHQGRGTATSWVSRRAAGGRQAAFKQEVHRMRAAKRPAKGLATVYSIQKHHRILAFFTHRPSLLCRRVDRQKWSSRSGRLGWRIDRWDSPRRVIECTCGITASAGRSRSSRGNASCQMAARAAAAAAAAVPALLHGSAGVAASAAPCPSFR